MVDIAGRTILQRTVRDEVLARVFGLQEGLAMAGLAVGAFLVPVFVGLVGLLGAIVLAAALLPVAVGLTWSRLAALDRRAIAPIRELELLRRTALFRPLPIPQLEAVARRVGWVTVPAGHVIIREGEPGDRFYVLASGAVKVERDGALLRELTSGDGFGEIALLRRRAANGDRHGHDGHRPARDRARAVPRRGHRSPGCVRLGAAAGGRPRERHRGRGRMRPVDVGDLSAAVSAGRSLTLRRLIPII